jgi:hypothetical protein
MNKIDLIIDALEYATQFGYDITTKESINGIDEALAAARELRALKPILWKHCGNGYTFEKLVLGAIPLYALDEVTK